MCVYFYENRMRLCVCLCMCDRANQCLIKEEIKKAADIKEEECEKKRDETFGAFCNELNVQ